MLTDLPPLAEIARCLVERTLRAPDLAEAALAAQALGAYRTTEPERTRAGAAAAEAAFAAGVIVGPLQGVPTSVKDLFGVPGWPTHGGTAVRLPRRFEEAGDVVGRLLAQLAVITGKTQTVELAFGGIGTNPHAGTPINPWDPARHRAPGGSSAGAGVSLLEGSALLALGTDTAGSVRIPAAWTGAVGLKTTQGRWSTTGIVPLSTTLDTPGILTRTVEDAAFAFRALDPRPMTIPDPIELSRVRVGHVASVFWDEASPGVVEAVSSALAELPCPRIELQLPPLDEALQLFHLGGPVSAELDALLAVELPGIRGGLDPNVEQRLTAAGSMSARDYLRRRHRLVALAAEAAAVLAQVDVVATPTVANTPPTLASLEDPATYRAQNLLCLRNTSVVSYLGLCALTLPCGLDDAGMPVGLQLIAGPGQEERLLGISLAVERTLGTGRQRLGVPPRLATSGPA